MKRKHKIIISAIVAIVLFTANAIVSAANKETSGKNSYLPIDLNATEDQNAEEPQMEETMTEKPTLSNLSNYFDTAIYLPTTFPYNMECVKVKCVDTGEGYMASVDYCSPDQQKYVFSTIQKAEKTNKEYRTLVFEDHAFEQNEVRVEDSTEMLCSLVTDGLIQAFLVKDNMFYQFIGNISTEELITIVESMKLAEETSGTAIISKN